MYKDVLMSKRDKIGAAILVGLFGVFFAVLVWTVEPYGKSRPIEENVFVKTRMMHLENRK